MRPQALERVALVLARDLGGALVALRVLARVPRQARHHQAQQRRFALPAHVADRRGDELECARGVGAVAVRDFQAMERAEVRRQVAARGLQLGAHRDAVAIVLYEEQQRQPLRGRDVERGPEAVGRGRGVAAVRHGDAACGLRVAEDARTVDERLRPADRRRVLRADAAAAGQQARARRFGLAARQAHDDADVAALAHAARAHHRRGERVLEREPERERERARAIVRADAIARTIEE